MAHTTIQHQHLPIRPVLTISRSLVGRIIVIVLRLAAAVLPHLPEATLITSPREMWLYHIIQIIRVNVIVRLIRPIRLMLGFTTHHITLLNNFLPPHIPRQIEVTLPSTLLALGHQ